MSNNILIQIAYEPEEGKVVLVDVVVPLGTSLSELNQFLPTGVKEQCTLQDGYYGVFGERQKNSYILVAGDRVEVYRSLIFDPMESRRRRAEHKRQKARQEKQ